MPAAIKAMIVRSKIGRKQKKGATLEEKVLVERRISEGSGRMEGVFVMKKILSVLLIFGLASVASAIPIPAGGGIGWDVVRSPGYENVGIDETTAMDASDIIYVDIVAYNPNVGADDYLGINSTGNIFVSIQGAAEFDLPLGEVRNNDITPAGLAAIGLTWYDQTDLFGADHMFDYFDPVGPAPPYLGFAYAGVHNPQLLQLAGGVDTTNIAWITAPGMNTDPVVIFDHIPIHCLGQGNIIVSVTGYPATGPGQADFGNPWIATGDSGFAAFGELAPGGGEIEIWQVPEPMTMALLGLGGLALIRRRRA
jgi:hypothetical protein